MAAGTIEVTTPEEREQHDPELWHICGEPWPHRCFQGNPECRSLCGLDLRDEHLSDEPPANAVECVVCYSMAASL